MGGKIESFVIGIANILGGIGVSVSFSLSRLIIFIISFANIPLDSATRIHGIALILSTSKKSVVSIMNNRFVATFIVVLVALWLY